MADPKPKLWAKLLPHSPPGGSAFPNNLQPFTVEIAEADASNKYGNDAIEVHQETTFTPSMLAAIKPVFLQVWHAGTLFKQKVASHFISPKQDAVIEQMWNPKDRSDKDERV